MLHLVLLIWKPPLTIGMMIQPAMPEYITSQECRAIHRPKAIEPDKEWLPKRTLDPAKHEYCFRPHVFVHQAAAVYKHHAPRQLLRQREPLAERMQGRRHVVGVIQQLPQTLRVHQLAGEVKDELKLGPGTQRGARSRDHAFAG